MFCRKFRVGHLSRVFIQLQIFISYALWLSTAVAMSFPNISIVLPANKSLLLDRSKLLAQKSVLFCLATFFESLNLFYSATFCTAKL